MLISPQELLLFPLQAQDYRDIAKMMLFRTTKVML
jgi:hypothetical protein